MEGIIPSKNTFKDMIILTNFCRVIFLMNLDYRKGDINFEDLNSDKNYDADVAFYQSQLANMLSVLHLAKQWRSENILVNAVCYIGPKSTQL